MRSLFIPLLDGGYCLAVLEIRFSERASRFDELLGSHIESVAGEQSLRLDEKALGLDESG